MYEFHRYVAVCDSNDSSIPISIVDDELCDVVATDDTMYDG